MEAEYLLDTPVVRGFIEDVKEVIAAASSPADACEQIRPRFARLLADHEWLPAEYQADAPESGMGGGIGQWLLYRAGAGGGPRGGRGGGGGGGAAACFCGGGAARAAAPFPRPLGGGFCGLVGGHGGGGDLRAGGRRFRAGGETTAGAGRFLPPDPAA